MKTVNNVLTVINKLLKVAVKWNAIERLPVQIELVKVPPPSLPFYDDFQYERLVKAAEKKVACNGDILETRSGTQCKLQ